MTFGLKSPREYIMDKHVDMQQSVLNALGGNDITVATIVSMHDGRQGQWILADAEYDKEKLARRLRLCADL